jgi:hypothetical protein
MMIICGLGLSLGADEGGPGGLSLPATGVWCSPHWPVGLDVAAGSRRAVGVC